MVGGYCNGIGYINGTFCFLTWQQGKVINGREYINGMFLFCSVINGILMARDGI